MIYGMEKCFNTAGPCIPAEHYMLPALDRLPEIRQLVGRRRCFVVHAPRQTGKTTALQALSAEINAKGEMVALYCTLETLQKFMDRPDVAIREIRHLILRSARAVGDLAPIAREIGEMKSDVGISTSIGDALQELCIRSPKPVVIFFDEVDCLVGDVLISFLRQLRDGYVTRAVTPFPASIALVGMLAVRDYKAQIRPDGESLGQISPFNIISEDMLLRNFSSEEVAALYAQHSDATGQKFAPGVLEKVMEFSGGQPWLVNALARECVEKIHGFRYGEVVTVADVETAKETIIRRRDTHVDSLMERLREPRIHRIIEYRDKRYAVEVKTAKNFKGEDSYRQLLGYLDKLGLNEGWMPIFDPDPVKPWEDKLYNRDIELAGKTLHIVGL